MKQQRWLLLAVVTTVIVITTVFAMLAVNVPQQDDYDSILYYLLNSRDSVLASLAGVHVSHRLVLTRLLARFSMMINGSLDLRLLMMLGLLGQLGSLYIYYRSLSRVLPRFYLLLVYCLLTLSLFHWSDLLWATASTQNYLGLFCALLALYLFNLNQTAATVFAILLGCFAPYISSNGLLILPLLAIWSLCSKPRAHASRRVLFASLVALSATSILFYLYGFTDSLTLASGSIVNEGGLLRGLVELGCAFLIALAGYLHFAVLAALAGAGLTACFGYFLYRRLDISNGFLFYSIAYLMLSVALVALFRSGESTQQLIASRYQIITLTLLALMITAGFELGLDRILPIKHLRHYLLALCTLFYLSSFYYVGNLLSEHDRIVTGIMRWRDSGAVDALYHPQPERAARILEQAIDSGIYEIPQHEN